MMIFHNDILFAAIFAGVIFLLSYFWSERILAILHKRSLGNKDYVIEKLKLMFVDVEPRKVTIAMLLMSFGTGSLFFLLFWPNIIIGLIVGGIFTVLGWTLPKIVVDYLYHKRCVKFTDQMVDALTLMANSLQNSGSIAQALQRAVDNIGQPLSQELQLVLSHIQLGRSAEEAFNELGARIPMPDVQMFVISINLNKETGGDLSSIFKTMVETIRERQKIERKIEALTAQGLMQGVIVTLVPFMILVVLLLVDPAYVKPLFSTTFGLILLLIMLSLQVIGGLVIRKIVKINV
jgi:tight adherence protein B